MGEHGRHFPRYAVIAMMGLGLNLLLMALAVNVLHLGYAWGLALVLMVVPLAGFLLQRNWSFTPGDAEAR
jgi:putative flippase GtrA